MRFRFVGRLTGCALCVSLAAASSSSAAPTGSARTVVIPARAPRSQMRAISRLGRRFSTPTCTTSGTGSFVGGGASNIAGGNYSGVLSGAFNDACDLQSAIVAGGFNGIGADSGASELAFIGAGSGNAVTNGPNGFVGAGSSNTVASTNGFIGAGESNTLLGLDAVIAGGSGNIAVGQYAAIGGGSTNRTPGKYAAVPGGYENYASGFSSFAGGNGAAAVTTGAFVWSDSAGGTQLVSSASNQFLAKASGGVKFYSNKTLTTGVMLGAGSGTWASVSDRAVKTNVAAIDDAGILDKVASLPISEWSYISEHGVRHVGPMAQDFYAAFGVGADNKHITSIDEDGVALAAIKALHGENRVLKVQLAETQRQLQKLSAVVASLRSR